MSFITSLGSVLGSREDANIAKMYLKELKDDGSPNKDIPGLSFQYFPETISDSRAVEWASKPCIGSSHPLYQWLTGSERRINFDVVFTKDTQPQTTKPSSGSFLGTVENVASAISNISKNPVGAAISALKGGGGHNVYEAYGNTDGANSVAAAIAWLRSKTYPSYQASRKLTSTPGNSFKKVLPPPKLLLYMPGSAITSAVKGVQADMVCVVMADCSVNYEAFFRNGAPRIVTVSLSFIEIVQMGSKGWGFVDSNTFNKQSGWAGIYQSPQNAGKVG